MSQIALSSIGSFNWRENRKLSTSVNSIQRDHDKQIRRLSVEQSRFISRATSRMMELVKTSLNEKERISHFERNRSAKVDVSSSMKRLNERNITSSSNKLLQNSMARLHSRPPLPKLIPTKQTAKKKLTNSGASNLENKENPKDVLKYRSPLNTKRQNTKDLLRPGKRDHTKPQSCLKLQPPQRSHRISMSFSIHPQSVSRQSIQDPSSKFLLMQRRRSCPNLGWYNDRILASGRTEKGALDGEGNLGKQMEEMKKCRYLRLPDSLQD